MISWFTDKVNVQTKGHIFSLKVQAENEEGAGRWDEAFGYDAQAARNCDILHSNETILPCSSKDGPAMFISVRETMSRRLHDSADFLRCSREQQQQ